MIFNLTQQTLAVEAQNQCLLGWCIVAFLLAEHVVPRIAAKWIIEQWRTEQIQHLIFVHSLHQKWRYLQDVSWLLMSKMVWMSIPVMEF